MRQTHTLLGGLPTAATATRQKLLVATAVTGNETKEEKMRVVTSHALLVRAAGLVAAVFLLAVADGRDALGQSGGRDRQSVTRDQKQVKPPPAVRAQSPVVRDHRGGPKQAPPGQLATDPAKARECTTTRISCMASCSSQNQSGGKISQEQAKNRGACNMKCNERETQCVAKAKYTPIVRDHRKR